MNHVLNTQLQKNKAIQLALMSIYGVGHSKSLFLCKKLGFLSNFKVIQMEDYQWKHLSKSMEDLITNRKIDLGLDLKNIVKQNEKNLINLSLYRGSRLKKGLPSKGQRTHSNAQTARRFTDKKRNSKIASINKNFSRKKKK